VKKESEEEFSTFKTPIVVGDNLERIGHLVSGRRGGEHPREERGGEDQGQYQKVRFEGSAGCR
jgi:hypothetical protein